MIKRVVTLGGDTVVDNIAYFLGGEPLVAGFDGHTNCFIETGFHKALLIDFNYETEPLPGHYPTGIGLQPCQPRPSPTTIGAQQRSSP